MAGEKGLFEVLKIGLNLNGDLPDRDLIRIARRCERLRIPVWIGDNELFKDPFYVADLLADHVPVLGFGVISINRGCLNILRNIEFLINEYRDTVFLLGIGAGRFKDSKKALMDVIECLRILRSRLGISIFCGCSSPIITRKSSEIADGILFNYGYPDFLSWILKFLKRRDIYKISYAPALILPSEFEYDLLIACSIVSCSSKRFIKEFGFHNMYCELSRLDFKDVIIRRKRGEPVDERIMKYGDVLKDKFAIAGDYSSFLNRILSLLNMCDHVVLGDPFFRDENSMRFLKKIIRNFKS